MQSAKFSLMILRNEEWLHHQYHRDCVERIRMYYILPFYVPKIIILEQQGNVSYMVFIIPH